MQKGCFAYFAYYPLQASAALRVFFSQLTTRPQELIQKSPLPDSEHHISSGEGKQRKPEYIPCRILLGLSTNTIFAATQCVQPALGQSRCKKIQLILSPRQRDSEVSSCQSSSDSSFDGDRRRHPEEEEIGGPQKLLFFQSRVTKKTKNKRNSKVPRHLQLLLPGKKR
jgi:hypothetical protein